MTADDTSFITTSSTSYKTTSDDLTEAETPDPPFRITQPAHTAQYRLGLFLTEATAAFHCYSSIATSAAMADRDSIPN
ncbi:hypothetical protein BGZ59_011743 [Podila verticillata]|nr:hypothetical protein BGZ59_011743 [Podila verticillata]